MELLTNISTQEIIKYCFLSKEKISNRLLSAHRKLSQYGDAGYNNESISVQGVKQEINIFESILRRK